METTLIWLQTIKDDLLDVLATIPKKQAPHSEHTKNAGRLGSVISHLECVVRSYKRMLGK